MLLAGFCFLPMKQRKKKRTHQRWKESELRGVSLPDDLYHITSQVSPLPIKTNLHSEKTTESCKYMPALRNMHISLPTRESTKPNRAKSGNAFNFAFLLNTLEGKARNYEEASTRRNIFVYMNTISTLFSFIFWQGRERDLNTKQI